MNHTEAMRRYFEKRKANHLCIKCGNPLDEENRVTCRACRLDIAQRTRILRADRHAKGLCVNCSAPMGRDEHMNCKKCRLVFAERMRNR